MKKSSILSFDPEDLIKKQGEENLTKENNLKLVKQFLEFFVVAPILLILFWKFSMGSIFNIKGIDYFQALCLNGVVKVLIRRI